MTVSITFKNLKKLTLRHIDSCYLSKEDNTWRFFNDLDDLEIEEELINIEKLGVEFDGDTVFVPHGTINSISFK